MVNQQIEIDKQRQVEELAKQQQQQQSLTSQNTNKDQPDVQIEDAYTKQIYVPENKKFEPIQLNIIVFDSSYQEEYSHQMFSCICKPKQQQNFAGQEVISYQPQLVKATWYFDEQMKMIYNCKFITVQQMETMVQLEEFVPFQTEQYLQISNELQSETIENINQALQQCIITQQWQISGYLFVKILTPDQETFQQLTKLFNKKE